MCPLPILHMLQRIFTQSSVSVEHTMKTLWRFSFTSSVLHQRREIKPMNQKMLLQMRVVKEGRRRGWRVEKESCERKGSCESESSQANGCTRPLECVLNVGRKNRRMWKTRVRLLSRVENAKKQNKNSGSASAASPLPISHFHSREDSPNPNFFFLKLGKRNEEMKTRDKESEAERCNTCLKWFQSDGAHRLWAPGSSWQ